MNILDVYGKKSIPFIISMILPFSALACAEKQANNLPVKSEITDTNRVEIMNTPQQKRIIVGIETDTDIKILRENLRNVGANEIMDDDAKSFGHLVITVDVEQNNSELIEKITKIQGVRYAEPDSMKSTY